MLKIMENELEIFRAWLFKYVKEDKKIKGKELAKKVGASESTITAYHSGRVVDGEKKFPNISFEKRQSILEVTGIPYQEMLDTGKDICRRHEIVKAAQSIKNPVLDELKKLGEENIKKTTSQTRFSNLTNITKQLQDLVEKFEDKEVGIEANQYLLELEKLDKDEFYAIIGILWGRVRNFKKKEAGPEQAQGK